MNIMNNFLSIKSITWKRDTHGLFDYECAEVKNNILMIYNKTNLVRESNEIIAQDDSSLIEEGNDNFVCNVSTKDKSKSQ